MQPLVADPGVTLTKRAALVHDHPPFAEAALAYLSLGDRIGRRRREFQLSGSP
jgi:hypothetical protein